MSVAGSTGKDPMLGERFVYWLAFCYQLTHDCFGTSLWPSGNNSVRTLVYYVGVMDDLSKVGLHCSIFGCEIQHMKTYERLESQ